MEANVTKIVLLQDTHQPLAFIEGYNNVAFHMFRFPPVTVRLERKTVLMERKATTGQPRDGLTREWFDLLFICFSDQKQMFPLGFISRCNESSTAVFPEEINKCYTV